VVINGVIRLIHSDRTIGIVPRWIEGLRSHYPDLDVRTMVVASGVAPRALADGVADIAFIGREMLEAEKVVFAARFGGEPRRFPGCGGNLDIPGTTHAVAVYVHADNPLDALSLAQLDAVLSTTRRRGAPAPALSWGDLGLTGEWAEQPIRLWGQSPDIGFDRFIQERILLGGEYRADIRLLDQVDSIPQRVADDRFSLGYAGLGHRVPGAKVLALADRPGTVPVPCEFAQVAAQRYPLSRRLYQFVPGTGADPIDPVVAELLSYSLSREGQQAVADDGLFFPLPENAIAEDRRRLAELIR
jgi:phosphate transport system substrate-binding protein